MEKVKPGRVVFTSREVSKGLQFSISNGYLNVGINRTGNGKFESEFFGSLISQQRALIIKVLKKLLASQGELQQTLTFQKWDKDEKKMMPTWALKLEKDAKGLFKITTRVKGESTTFENNIRMKSALINGDQITDSEAGNMSIEELLDFLVNADIPMLLTSAYRPAYNPNQRRSGSNGGGGGESAPAKSGDSNDDFTF